MITGDLGSIDADGFVTVAGRKQDIINPLSGKNITAANIETALKHSRWISEAVVCGDNRPYLVNKRFAHTEQVKRYAILNRELSQSDGRLTPTLKVKRNVVYRNFADVFNALDEQSGSS